MSTVEKLADEVYGKFLDSLDTDLSELLRKLPFNGDAFADSAAQVQMYRLLRELLKLLERNPCLDCSCNQGRCADK